MVRIEQVYPEGIAAELGLQAGDCLRAINGAEVRDLIDLHLQEQQEQLLIEVRRQDGELWELEIEKDSDEPLGLEVEHPEPQQCGNQCVFCFVHQLPKGMRRSLYIKDEDYRFSYLYGAYITLGNITEEELARIEEQHLSPLYISVHATDEEIRCTLLGKRVPPIMPLLKRLISAGIELHTQVVLCPGINDGDCLEKTVDDLHRLGPQVVSLAIVPVGLTGHRQRLYPLRTLTAEEANRTLAAIHRLQKHYLSEQGCRFVFAADELYLQAQQPFPPLDDYEDLPQIENGVGLIPVFREEACLALETAEPLGLERVTLVTGSSFAPELERFAVQLSQKVEVELQVLAVSNQFFSGGVSVAGLITGSDILNQLSGADLGDGLLLPDVMFREGQEVLLDDVSREELEQKLGVRVLKTESSPWGVLDALDELDFALAEPGHD